MKIVLYLTIVLFSVTGWSLPKELYTNPIDRNEIRLNPSWENFQRMMAEQKRSNETEGMAYVISGSMAFLGGIVGYQNSTDLFAKGAYALSQSLGVAAVGYGAHLRLVGHQDQVLYDLARTDHFLNPVQRDQFVKIYFELEAKREKESQKIAALTHGLLAGLNLYNGAMAKNEDLRSTLYFIAAINVLACVNYSF